MKTVKQFERENRLHERETEFMGVFNQKGELIFSKEGNVREVVITNEEADFLYSSDPYIYTHNHPTWSPEMEKILKEKYDSSIHMFSLQDIRFGIHYGMEQIRLITSKAAITADICFTEEEFFKEAIKATHEINGYKVSVNSLKLIVEPRIDKIVYRTLSSLNSVVTIENINSIF